MRNETEPSATGRRLHHCGLNCQSHRAPGRFPQSHERSDRFATSADASVPDFESKEEPTCQHGYLGRRRMRKVISHGRGRPGCPRVGRFDPPLTCWSFRRFPPSPTPGGASAFFNLRIETALPDLHRSKPLHALSRYRKAVAKSTRSMNRTECH